MRELHEGNRASRLSTVVDELPGRTFSDQCPSERRENDERASQRITREYFAIFPSGRDNFLHLIHEGDKRD